MEDRERRIVETAVALAEEGGFEAVRLRDVASHAGVALGTLYRHFRSKEDLLVAALASEAEGLEREMRRHPPEGRSARERLTAYFEAATATLCRKPKLARAILRAASSDEAELAGKVRAFHSVATSLVIAALRGDPDATVEDASADELKVCTVLQSVWFSALIGWMGGMHDQAEVVAQVGVAAELILRD